MKQGIFFIFLVTVIFSNYAYANSCRDDLRFLFTSADSATKYTEIELKDKIGRLESVIDRFRIKKGNAIPAIDTYYSKIIAEIDANILVENFSIAHRLLRTIFRDVEFSYFFIKKINPLMDKFKTISSTELDQSLETVFKALNLSSDDIKLLDAVVNRTKKAREYISLLEDTVDNEMSTLAKQYQGYSLHRAHLEGIVKDVNCGDATCTSGTTTLLDKLGVASIKERERFPLILENELRPSTRDLQKLVSSNSYMNLIRLKVERNFEIAQFFSNLFLQPHVVNAFFDELINFPGMHKTRFVRLFKVIYNKRARELYFPKINKIIRSTALDDKSKLGLMKDLNSKGNNDELLITFARRVDNRSVDGWDKLKKVANKIDKPLAKRMDEAKEKAIHRGSISSSFKKSYANKLASLLVIGGAGAYFTFGFESIEIIDLNDPLNTTGFSIKEITNDETNESSLFRETGELNSTIKGMENEPFFPMEEIERVAPLEMLDEELESDLQLLENFALR